MLWFEDFFSDLSNTFNSDSCASLKNSLLHIFRVIEKLVSATVFQRLLNKAVTHYTRSSNRPKTHQSFHSSISLTTSGGQHQNAVLMKKLQNTINKTSPKIPAAMARMTKGKSILRRRFRPVLKR